MSRLRVPPLPSRREDWTAFAREVVATLARPPFAAVAVVAATASLLSLAVVENRRVVVDVVIASDAPIGTRLTVLAYLVPGVGGFDPAVDGGVFAVAMATGVAAAVSLRTLLYRRRVRPGLAGAGLGMTLGLLGGGCVACGSALLAALFSAGAAGWLVVLPFDGAAIPWVAAGLLVLSIYWVTVGPTPSPDDGGTQDNA